MHLLYNVLEANDFFKRRYVGRSMDHKERVFYIVRLDTNPGANNKLRVYFLNIFEPVFSSCNVEETKR